MTVALCLVGGGAKLLTSTGMLRYIIKNNVKFDMILGTSSGALSAALISQGDYDALEHIALTVTNKDIRSFAPWLAVTPKACLYDSSPLRRTLEKYIDKAKLIASPYPTYVTVTNLSTNCAERYRLDRKPPDNVIDILLASASPPTLVAPVAGTYADGGICDDYNVLQAIEDGATEVIILHPDRPGAWKFKNISEAISIIAGLPEWNNYIRQMEAIGLMPDATRPKIKVVIPPAPTGLSLFDFDYKGIDRQKYLDDGYKLAQAVLG